MSAERLAVVEASPWWGEHEHRYRVAVASVKSESRILDLACGTGYGTDILAAAAPMGITVGGDLAVDAVAESASTFRRDRLAFGVMDGTALPFRSGTIDLVMSFETVEHTTRYREMVAEFARILRPSGTLCLSTPNIRVNSPDGVVRNPFHTQEFTREELRTVLGASFGTVNVQGQRYVRYDHRTGPAGLLGRVLEWLLYRRGLRKLPTPVQDAIIRPFTGTTLYPSANDYALVSEPEQVEACQTLFATCRP